MNSYEKGHLIGMLLFYIGIWVVLSIILLMVAHDIISIITSTVIGLVSLYWSIRYYKKDFQEWRKQQNDRGVES